MWFLKTIIQYEYIVDSFIFRGYQFSWVEGKLYYFMVLYKSLQKSIEDFYFVAHLNLWFIFTHENPWITMHQQYMSLYMIVLWTQCKETVDWYNVLLSIWGKRSKDLEKYCSIKLYKGFANLFLSPDPLNSLFSP